MKKLIITTALFLSVCVGFAQQTIELNKTQQVFFGPDVKATITKLPFDNLPDYFGGGKGVPWCFDFPISPVEIDGEYWIINKSGDGPTIFRWKGTNIEDCKRQPDGLGQFPVQRPYMLGGLWYDKKEKKLYAPMHCEYYDGSGAPQRQIHLASSTDKGLTWKYEGPVLTRDDPGKPQRKPSDFSGLYWDGGTADFFIYVDERGGYIYLYTGAYVWRKDGEQDDRGFVRHQVARCAIGDKMMSGKWKKFYNGKWEEPGLGGKGSYVDAYYVTYNTYLGKYMGMTYGNSIAFCTDLSKQDWTPGFKVPGDLWGYDISTFEWHVTDSAKMDVHNGGQTLYMYTYINSSPDSPAKKYKIELSKGELSNGDVYAHGNKFFYSINTMDPAQLYPIEPLYESADPIESRHTRRVHCTSPEMAYFGKWDNDNYEPYHEKSVKKTETAGSTVQFSFRGADVYWRTVKGPDCGKADVYIDGQFQKTIDCYASKITADQFGFIKTGLDPNVAHSIKVAVRGDKGSLSNGNVIRHLLFEYSADSYRASDGFSDIQGKNGWYYQQKKDGEYSNMGFDKTKWTGDKCPVGGYWANEIDLYYIAAVTNDVALKWVVPHGGTVRIEGEPFHDSWWDKSRPEVMIQLNDKEMWSYGANTTNEKQSHDFTISVKKGDVVRFVAKGSCEKNINHVNWDPVVTYVDGTGEIK